jgi:hypothetical protein
MSIQTARTKLAQPDPLWDRVLDSFGWFVGIGGFAVSVMDDIASGLHPTV